MGKRRSELKNWRREVVFDVVSLLGLTRLEAADLNRQLERGDVVGSHDPVCTAASPVLHAERRDRRAPIGPWDPRDVYRTLCRHGDSGAVGSLRYYIPQKGKESFKT